MSSVIMTEIDELNSLEVDSGTEDASPCRLNDDSTNHLKLTISSLSASPETPSIPSTPASLVNQSLLSPGLGSPGAQSTSSGSGIGADPVHDLPAELLSAGWRKFWSRREGRPYFYNKTTAESRWEMPSLAGQTDPLVDPLGLHSPVGSPPVVMSNKSARHSSIDVQPNPPLKRSISEDFQVVKKQAFNYSPYWCFTIPSNVVIYEQQPSSLFPPHVEIEILRSHSVNKLRQTYQELCRTRESIEAPVDSFNRWLLERKVVDRNPIDPLLPSSCPNEISPSMHREIMSDIPMRLVKSKYVTDLRRQFVKYAEAAQRMMAGAMQASADSRRLVKWHAEDALDWLRKERNASYEDLLERLTHLRRQCQPHLSDAASSSVDGICSKLYSMACDAARKIRERHKQIYAEFKIQPVEHVRPSQSRHRVMCYPIHLATPNPPPVTVVERKEQTDCVLLTYKNETLRINVPHFHKLEQLYQLNCRDDPRFDHFLARVWCLLKRYQAFFGSSATEGVSLQGALPLAVFECLHRVFGVTFECFASPLNCYFKQYCSAFADTDGYFGSRGPILEFYPLSGSFEANPPFSEELMEAMVDHFESLLSESQEPLSFTVFIPDFRDPPPEALIRLESSRFNRKQITITAHEHEYRHGFQHACPSSELNMTSAHGTLVVFLQNDAGFLKWEPTTDRLRELLIAYRPAQIGRRLSTSR